MVAATARITAYVLIAALALFSALAFLVVLGPVFVAAARRFVPQLVPFEWNITLARYSIATTILVFALVSLTNGWPRRAGESSPKNRARSFRDNCAVAGLRHRL